MDSFEPDAGSVELHDTAGASEWEDAQHNSIDGTNEDDADVMACQQQERHAPRFDSHLSLHNAEEAFSTRKKAKPRAPRVRKFSSLGFRLLKHAVMKRKAGSCSVSCDSQLSPTDINDAIAAAISHYMLHEPSDLQYLTSDSSRDLCLGGGRNASKREMLRSQGIFDHLQKLCSDGAVPRIFGERMPSLASTLQTILIDYILTGSPEAAPSCSATQQPLLAAASHFPAPSSAHVLTSSLRQSASSFCAPGVSAEAMELSSAAEAGGYASVLKTSAWPRPSEHRQETNQSLIRHCGVSVPQHVLVKMLSENSV
ncbi:hypothetical protein GUITHDRAFT_102328 [Guillardia theta CCMP2712]|uniref:Uncharacterized protein n=1 Tax=Guillardia theta (strain CCMP2712) TaxID=905079 RepID=L1JUF5_GUITC|nr:hypothetical protein GUITHDRAFT_102328 [Guillardia theta CCMP2712]EKX51723.1 hypothetical protein GUITHDRAFT_102328 [Guillardia theta CCMP2712]|eukprot:XP_005838703.1 hypothetical protein GUITHDRAFT_102328 [Guillardia theta CCMP2712]